MNTKISSFNIPILFIIFNRIETTSQVFHKIKEIKPNKLYISSDGPREFIYDETDVVNEVRKYVLSQIDWDCDVFTLFHKENLGCGKAVNAALNWFFKNVEKGIILEDDCLPDTNFFYYCEMALKRYEFNTNVSIISGFNSFGKFVNSDVSFFSENPSVWGWATWSNRMLNYDFEIKSWPLETFKNYLKIKFPKEISEYYIKVFTEVKQNKIDTWDYQLTYFILLNSGLTLKPKSNLIQNIGTEGAHANGRDRNHYIPFGNIDLIDHKFPEFFIPDLQEDYKFYERFKKSISFTKLIQLLSIKILVKIKYLLKNILKRII